MVAGVLYDPGDPELVAMRQSAQLLMAAYNATTLVDHTKRNAIKRELFGAEADQVTIRAPFYVDYGTNIYFKGKAFLNYGVTILDVTPVTIGDNAQIGPHVKIISADHPHDAQARASGLENGAAVTIGENVWIGASAILLPGITVGDNAIIGAGSIVTKDIPANTTVAGNPARIIKRSA